jgi:hypothetical protein
MDALAREWIAQLMREATREKRQGKPDLFHDG